MSATETLEVLYLTQRKTLNTLVGAFWSVMVAISCQKANKLTIFYFHSKIIRWHNFSFSIIQNEFDRNLVRASAFCFCFAAKKTHLYNLAGWETQ